MTPPSLHEVRAILSSVGLSLDDSDATDVTQWVGRALALAEGLADGDAGDAARGGAGGTAVDGAAPARTWRWATREEDPLNAFVTFCDVAPNGAGPLDGLRVAVKDCIALAGVPQTEGGGREPYCVPGRDAVAVERLLAAGAHVVGKTNMEDLAVGTGVGSHRGATRNPVNPAYITGGSSGGSAAAVGAAMADVGLGTDQAGSVRIPAAWCGLVGMKATYGRVPTAGISRMDPTVDHVGPITRDVATNMAALACMAGADARDRSTSVGAVPAVVTAAGAIAGRDMRLGVVAESMASDLVAPDVAEALGAALGTLAAAGATVVPARVARWGDALGIFATVVSHGMLGTWHAAGVPYGIVEHVDPAMVAGALAGRGLRTTDVHPRVVTRLVVAEHLRRRGRIDLVGRAQDLRIALSAQIEDALGGAEVLVTPTVATVATALPGGGRASRPEMMAAGRELANTCPLDLSGHPALTVPCGRGADGLPVGLQLVGRWYDEATLYRYALAVEELVS